MFERVERTDTITIVNENNTASLIVKVGGGFLRVMAADDKGVAFCWLGPEKVRELMAVLGTYLATWEMEPRGNGQTGG